MGTLTPARGAVGSLAEPMAHFWISEQRGWRRSKPPLGREHVRLVEVSSSPSSPEEFSRFVLVEHHPGAPPAVFHLAAALLMFAAELTPSASASHRAAS